MMKPARHLLALTALAAGLGGCNLAPRYQRPATVAIPPSFKELPDWRTATPSDAVARGAWWELFNDPVLNDLEGKVLVSNQNLAQAKAAFDQARALVRQQRAALFPTVTINGRGSDQQSFRSGSAGQTQSVGSIGPSSNGQTYQLTLGASWEPDLWGSIGNSLRQAKAQAQASAGDLANATLSAQGELALDYLQLRGFDAQKDLLDKTIAAYQEALQITVNRYNAGVAAQSDIEQARTQLYNAQAQATDLIRQRAAMEHAVAVLVGENPSTFSIAPAAWNAAAPDIPAVLPSDLLERRPDIASAERQVAAANYNIGIQRAAAFPQITLTGEGGTSASAIGNLFSAGTSAWSLGLSGLFTLLDFGANKAKVAQARAAWEQTVAQYRQTVLGAFQQTEDQLAAIRVLRDEVVQRGQASQSAVRAEEIVHNQYLAGTAAYSDVIVAQTASLSARVTEIQTVTNRQLAAVSLIEAIGGKWTGTALGWTAGAREVASRTD